MKRRILSALLAVVLVVAMTAPAMAVVQLKNAGIYGVLKSISYQSGTNIYGETWITENPDNAYLLVKMTINQQSGNQVNIENSSSRGVTLHTYTKYYTAYADGYLPTRVFFCGEVRGGTQSPEAYVTATRNYSIDLSYYN